MSGSSGKQFLYLNGGSFKLQLSPAREIALSVILYELVIIQHFVLVAMFAGIVLS